MTESTADALEDAAEGVEHLQAAALQLIAAARSFLSVAEHVVHRPEVVSSFVTTMGALAKIATQAMAAQGASGAETAAGHPVSPPGGPVERIRLG